jgi:hypothetical protein
MTRAEAEKIWDEAMNTQGPIDRHPIVGLAALGIITLEEPKSIDQRVTEAIHTLGNVRPVDVKRALEAAGLAVVEKS